MKVFKKVVTLFLIFTLVAANFINLGFNIVLAISDDELESQTITTSYENVDFDAYFKNQDQKVHSSELNISSGGILYLSINVRDTGTVKDAKINMQGSNFKIDKSRISSEFIKEVNEEGNEVTLNNIASNKQIEVEIPIQFEKQENINLDYFNKQNNLTLSAKYVDENERERNITGSKVIKAAWTDDVEIETAKSVEKYFALPDGRVLLQELLNITVKDNKLPLETENIEVKAPSMDEKLPRTVEVLLNGEKIESYNYNAETGILNISRTNERNENNEISWGTGNEQYKIIYIYDNTVTVANRVVELNSKVSTKLYTKEETVKEDVNQVEIAQMGNITSLSVQNTQSLYKGYLYANVSNETLYEQNQLIEVSNADSVSSLQVSSVAENYSYTDERTQTKIYQNAKGNTYFKSTILNKENLVQILGEQGIVNIQNEDGSIIKQILLSEEPDENGNFVINYEGNTTNSIIIDMTDPIEEGIIKITHEKAIKGQTGYTKEQLKQFTSLEEELKLVTDVQETAATMQIQLLDTVTQANLSVSNTNFSTYKENENVEFVVTLNSNNEKYDLYKNPRIEIQLPQEFETIKVNSINTLYMEEFQITSARLVNTDTERNKIIIEFAGEQTEFKNDVNQGAKIVINANITVNKDTPSKISEIQTTYTNENGAQERYSLTNQINFTSQYGVFSYTDVSNYNEDGNVTTALTNETATAEIDANVDRKVIDVETAIINNYDEAIGEVAIIGQIPQNGEQNTFSANMQEQISANIPDAVIVYSYEKETNINSDKWMQTVDDFSKVKSFKITLNSNLLESKQILKVAYKIEIPANLDVNQSSNLETKTSYLYQGQQIENTEGINLRTPQGGQNNQSQNNNTDDNSAQSNEETNGIQTSIRVTSGEKDIADGEEVYEGQTLSYEVRVTNNTGSTLKNVHLTAEQKNAIFFANVAKEVISVEQGGESAEEIFYEEDETLTQLTKEQAELQQGDTLIFNYEFTVAKEEDPNQTSGSIVISADGLENINLNTYTNPIKDAELKIVISDVQKEEQLTYTNSIYAVKVKISSYLSEAQDATLQMEIPKYMEVDTENFPEDYEFVSLEDNILTLKVPEITTEPKEFIIPFMTTDLELNEKLANITFMAKLISETNQEYNSNILRETINQAERKIEVVQKGSIEEDTVKDGDQITYTTSFINATSNENSKNLQIHYVIPDGLDVQSAYILKNQERKYVELVDGVNTIQAQVVVEPGETVQLVIDTVVNLENAVVDQTEISSIVTCVDTADWVDVYSNEVVYTIDYEEEPEEPDPDPGEPDPDPGEPDPEEPDPDNPGTDDARYQITGMAWIDQNKNGLRESSERAMNNIKVKLLDAQTGESVADNGNVNKETTTDSNGAYTFSELKPGRYIVVFEYDNTRYRLTEYKKQGVSENINSDVITNDDGTAITDAVLITDDSIDNLDAGFIENERFDLSMQKTVNRITVRDSAGTKVSEFNGAELAKVEVDAKRLQGAIVVIDYQITIKNEGELPGYVNEIIDYIPDDLEFNSEMNTDWYLSTDGNLHNISLTNQVINPGEEKTITLTLLKTMNVNNTGTTINMAEIARASNELSIEDSDSTPGNLNQTEDDMGTAEVIISVKTGVVFAVSFGLILLLLVGTGIVIYILKRKEVKNAQKIS